ncbi:uncharacterized protein LOC114758183 isoform X1 [Neltuma alba]|uniref:uncharacterized protein LOC114758183 isoform X1 n=1 Tax=Neltuma alba TaxID=207710 RepID=UPI0010A388EB|nr:uncharacterized protein LOC114758183 isoform X1 [Prosopis alba]
MAVHSSCEGGPLIAEFLKGNGSEPADCRCAKSLKSSPTDASQCFSSEIPPILVEDASLPSGLYQPLSSSPGQDVYSVSLLSKDVDDAHCASPPTFLSILEVPNQSKDPICLDAQLDCQNCFDFRVESEEGYSPCIIDMPSGNENSVSSQSYEEGVESLKSENLLSRLFWRQANFKSSGRAGFFSRLDAFLTVTCKLTDKSVTEKVHDMPNNKCRRLKRSASFDSRKVAFLFSILSSLGSLVLIYLTLRIRQKAKYTAICLNWGQ